MLSGDRFSRLVRAASACFEFTLAETETAQPCAGSEVIRVREQLPPLRVAKQLVARPGISDHALSRVESIPVHAHEDRVLAELASVGLEPLPCLNTRRTPIRADGRSEVIPHGPAVGHVDRLSSSDRNERHVAEVGHASHVACCVAPDVLIQERLNRGSHENTLAAVAAPVNVDAQSVPARTGRDSTPSDSSAGLMAAFAIDRHQFRNPSDDHFDAAEAAGGAFGGPKRRGVPPQSPA